MSKRSADATVPRGTRKIGRPSSFRPEFVGTVARLARLGATEAEMAEALGVSLATLKNWKPKQPEFLAALRAGKVEADMAAADSLFNRTQFHEYRKVIPFKVKRVEYKDGKRVLETEEIVEKEVIEVLPPSDTALIFWLKNRRPVEWRDRRDVDVTSKGEQVAAVWAFGGREVTF